MMSEEKIRKVIIQTEIIVDILYYPKDKKSIGLFQNREIELCFAEKKDISSVGYNYIFKPNLDEVWLYRCGIEGGLYLIIKKG